MKNIYLILILLSIAVGVNAQYTSVVPGGLYTTPASWNSKGVPVNTWETITIIQKSKITHEGNFSWGPSVQIYGTFKINGSYTNNDWAAIEVMNGGRLEIFGDVLASISVNVHSGATMIVHGDMELNGASHSLSGNIIVTGDVKLSNVTLNLTGNLVIGGDLEIDEHGGNYNNGDIYLLDPNAKQDIQGWNHKEVKPGDEDDLIRNETDKDFLDELKNLGLIAGSSWTGTKNRNWNEPENWNPQEIPSSSTSVKIDYSGDNNPKISENIAVHNITINNGTVTIVKDAEATINNINITNGSLILKAGAKATMHNISITSGTANIRPGARATINGNINVNNAKGGKLVIEHDLGDNKPASVVHTGSSTGDVTVKVTFPSLKRNWYIGHPVVSNRDDYGTDFDVWSFNHSNGAWPVVSAGTSMGKPTDGYVVINKSGVERTVTHTGALATGNQKVNLTTSSPNGFNLIANPYNGYLNPKLLDFTGMRPTIWYRTVVDNNYVFTTYNVVAGVPLPYDNDELIAPMQAFWVRTDVDNKELTFSNSLLSLVHPLPLTEDNPKFKSSQLPVNDVLYIQLSNSISSDQTAIAFRENGSTELSRIDSDKRLNASKVPDIYTIKSNKQVAISIMPELEENTSIKMGFSLLKDANKELYIEAVDINNFMPGTEVWLVDNHTGIRTNLRTSGYSFNADAGTDNSRFTVEIGRVATGIEDNDTVENSNAIQVYAANGNAIVKVDDPKGDVVVNIYNLAGQLVNSTKEASSRIEVALPASRNVYVVEVQTGDTVFKKKIVH